MNPNAPSPGVIESELVGDDHLHDLVEMFVGELPDRVTAIRKCLDEANLLEFARLIHQLKGSAGGYGFPRITEAARHVEVVMKASHTIEDLKAVVDEIADLCAQARPTVRREANDGQARADRG